MTKKISDINWEKSKDNLISRTNSNVQKTKELLNSTGQGFCLAKFTQVTMHLGTGKTHACHHPVPHVIPIKEVTENPAALFNTSHLKKARSQMLTGERPPECDYCWRIEDNNNYSDRFFKSLEPWAIQNHDSIKESGPDIDYKPTYLEVDFSNVCNFKCIYCGPEFSSKWVEELKQNGPIKLLEGTDKFHVAQGWQNLENLSYKNSEFNPYIDAFWKWWPDVYNTLKVYRITGGEPLLSKETFRSIDWLIENPNKDLEFSINTNLGAPDKLWDQFIEKITILSNGDYVKSFTIFTSVDAWGERAEYLRPGLDFQKFKDRYEQLLKIGTVRVTTMCTFNILSISSIEKLFEWHLELRKKYNPHAVPSTWEKETGYNFAYPNSSYTDRVSRSKITRSLNGIDLPYLRAPTFLDAKIATSDLIQNYLIPSINFMSDNTSTTTSWTMFRTFDEFELEKYKRVCLDITYASHHESILKPDDNLYSDLNVNRAKFFDFVNELDRRYEKKFLDVFPEYKNFYESCRQSKTNLINKRIG